MKSNTLKYLAALAMAAATVTSSYGISLTATSLPAGSPVAFQTLNFTGNGLGGVPLGTLYSAVYGTPGAYTFVYQIANTGGSAIDEYTGNGFFPSIAPSTVGYVTGNTDPSSATLDALGNLNVFFQSPTLPSGGTSDYIVLVTTAMSYGNFPAGVIDGGVAPSFAYGPNVPDGGMTIMLLGAALSGMALLRRKLA